MPADKNSFGQTPVSRFPTVDKVGETVTIDAYIAECCSGTWKETLDQIRAEKNEDKQRRLKAAKLPAYSLSGTFNDLHSKNGLIAHSGILVMDFDHLASKGIVATELRDKASADSHVYAAVVSPRGDGVKLMVRIEPLKERHEASFARAREYFLEKYGVSADPSGKDLFALVLCHARSGCKGQPRRRHSFLEQVFNSIAMTSTKRSCRRRRGRKIRFLKT